MAIYRNVHLTFWTDNKVADDFTPEDKYFYLYLLTNPHTNLCGCWEYSLKQMADETGYSKDTIERLLIRFQDVHNVIKFSKTTKEVMLLNWGRYNWTKSPKVESALKSEIDTIKSNEFKTQLESELYGDDAKRDDVEGPDSITTDVVNIDSKKEADNKEHDNKEHDLIVSIVTYLNQKAGTKYRSTSKSTQRLIKARLHEKFTEEDFYTVIDKKVEEWINSKEMAQYIRPETLFGNKFEGYLNQRASAPGPSNGVDDTVSYLLGGGT